MDQISDRVNWKWHPSTDEDILKSSNSKKHNVEDGPEVPLMRALRAMKKFRRHSCNHPLLRQGVEDAIYEIESWRPGDGTV